MILLWDFSKPHVANETRITIVGIKTEKGRIKMHGYDFRTMATHICVEYSCHHCAFSIQFIGLPPSLIAFH